MARTRWHPAESPGASGLGRRSTATRLALAAVAVMAATIFGPPSSVPASGADATSAGRLPPAPTWPAAPHAIPERPARCAPLHPGGPAGQATTDGSSSVTGDPLWPPPPTGTNPEHYARHQHTSITSPPVTPSNWTVDGNDWKLTSQRTSAASVASNPQELCGVEGNSVDTAWQTTTGRPTTVIAVLDSGIEWCNPGIVDKIALNRAALPPPKNAQGLTKTQLKAKGQHFDDADPYDLDGTGVLDVAQYATDPRVAAVAATYGGFFCADEANNGGSGYEGISPEDLIRTFARPRLGNGQPNPYVLHRVGPAGFTEAIAGWNFVDNNDDPYDDVSYGHGTGEALDMAGAADTLSQEVGACPSCMVLPVRVGTSFIASGNAFAQGLLFAVDAGATVASEALGAYDETETAQQAIDYAAARGVPVVASAADEESEHQNLPASASNKLIVVNSTTQETGWMPPSYLYLNGCTNYGPQISVTVESSSCSSEATGKTAGVVGLVESAAAQAVARGTLKDYPGLRNAAGRPVPLSANEVHQLVDMSADDVNFTTPAPNASPPAPGHNYSVSAPGVPVASTTMYPTTKGYDEYTGWGRLDAARMVRWVAEGRIPPEAEIDDPQAFETFDPASSGDLVVKGMVGAVRARSFRYQVDVAAGATPGPHAWRLVTEGTGQGGPAGVRRGVLARLPLASLATLFPGGLRSLRGGAVSAGGRPEPDRFSFAVRIVVEDDRGLVGISQVSDFAHQDRSLLDGFPVQLSSSIVAPPRLAPLGPHHENVLLVAESGGTIHAYLPDGHELAGWPVHTRPLPAHLGEEAFTSQAVTARPHGEVIGGVAVGDLFHDGGRSLDVVASDLAGYVYAWNARGRLLPGWPVRTDPAYSAPQARNAENRLLPGVAAAPALGDLEGNGTLDVVAAAMDRHVYAWTPTGHAVPGWPVLVIDPSKVQAVDPATNAVTFRPGADPLEGTELIDTPAIGHLRGSRRPDVVVGSDEEYAEAPNANLGTLGAALEALGRSGANARVYAIWPDGSKHAAAPGAPAPPGMPDPGAFLPGWPVKVADLDPGLLPTIGDGVTASPALGRALGPKGGLDVITSSTLGPAYVLRADGTSALGTTDGLPNVTQSWPEGTNPDSDLLAGSVPALGGPLLAPLGTSRTPSVVDPAGSLGRLLDEAEPGNQSPHDNQLGAWSARTGQLESGYPTLMNDLQFFDYPIAADVDGTEAGSFVVEASGLYDLRAYGEGGTEAPGFPKFTGGWTTFGAAFGPFGDQRDQVLVAGTRSGTLLVWRTPTAACAPSGPSPQVHHDLWNSGDLANRRAPTGGLRCSAGRSGP